MLCGFVCLKKKSYHYLRWTWLNPYLFNANQSNFYADPLVLCNTLQSFPHIVSIITILGLVSVILSHSYLSTPGEDTSGIKSHCKTMIFLPILALLRWLQSAESGAQSWCLAVAA